MPSRLILIVRSWLSCPAVRHAAVVAYFQGQTTGFVLAGRSMREVEIRERNLMIGVTVGWLFTLLSISIIVAALGLGFKKYA